MAPIPGLSEALIRQHAPGEMLSRARGYASSGAVVSLTRRGNLLEALVEGSEPKPYRVGVSLDAAGVTGAACTCPYDGASWCKHIAAALLVALEHPEQIVERPPLSALLSPLDRPQLQALIERIAARQPELVEAIELDLSPPQTAPAASPKLAAAPPPPLRHTPVDPEPLRRQVRSLMNPRNRDYDDYMYGATVQNAMEPIIERVRGFLAGGDGANALRLLDAVTTEYARGWYNFDEEGELGGILNNLGDLWAEALLSPDVGDEERAAFAPRLSAWADEADEYDSGDHLRMAARAATEGWDDPAIAAALGSGQNFSGTQGARAQRDDAEDEYEDDEPYEDEDDENEEPAPSRPPIAGMESPAERLLTIRLRVLERQGRADEYLNLAAAAGRGRERALMLARLGRSDEALAAGLRDLASANDALAVATALREGGELDGALRVGAHGLGLAEPRAALGSWLATLAASMDHGELAQEAAEVAFRSEPTLARYQTVRDLAGEGWERKRVLLLAFLRDEAARWRSRTAAIDIFLHENLIDDAITAVGNSGYGDAMARVMDAATSARPDWVIDAATRQAAEIIDRGAAQHYDDAVAWMRRARAAYRAANRVADWQLYLLSVRAKHGRKYKLMGLIDKLESQT